MAAGGAQSHQTTLKLFIGSGEKATYIAFAPVGLMCLLVPPLISLSSHTPSLPHSLTATNLSCSEPIYIAYYNHAGDRSGHANFKSLPPLSFWKRFDCTSHFGCHCHVSSY